MAKKELSEALQEFSSTVDEVKSALWDLNSAVVKLHKKLSEQSTQIRDYTPIRIRQEETNVAIRQNGLELAYLTAELKYRGL